MASGKNERQQHLEHFEPHPVPEPVEDGEQRDADGELRSRTRSASASRSWSAVAAAGALSATAGLAASAGFAGSVGASPGAAFAGSAGSSCVRFGFGLGRRLLQSAGVLVGPGALASSLGSSTALAVFCAPASTSPAVSTATSGAVANCHVTPSSATINSAGIKLMSS